MADPNYVAGSLTLQGFVAGGDDTFAQAGTYDAGPGSNFLFNWTGSLDGAGVANGPEVVTASGGSEFWSLTVTLSDMPTGQQGQQLFYGNIAEGTAATHASDDTFTFYGDDSTSLTQVVEALNVGTPNGVSDAFNISFQLSQLDSSHGPVSGAGDDTFGWTEHFANVSCYRAGTRIATARGEVAVESLAIGDRVVTASGALKPVKWVGRRAYAASDVASNRHLQPVLVRKDAIAPGMPHRDLMVSPMHALFVDDAFVPAISLVNGVSILRCDDLMAVSYVHIEMDGHDVIFAEGLPAETFVDDNSRLMFENADEFYALYGADHVAVAFAAPRLEEGVQLEALRRRIAARAGVEIAAVSSGMLRGNVERVEDGVLHGWMADVTGSAPVEVEILVDGEVVARTIANRYRVDLDHAGIAGGIAGFTAALPASVENLAQVSVRRAGDGMALGARAAKATV